MNLDNIVVELKAERDRLSRAIEALDGVTKRVKVRRKLSADARERIAAAQRARWAKQKRKQ